jgi:hypothetical protein
MRDWGCQLGDCPILVSIIQHRAVVRAEDHKRVIRQAVLIQGIHDFADGPIELQDGFATRSGAAFALETLVWYARHVIVMGREKQEEALVLGRRACRDAVS